MLRISFLSWKVILCFQTAYDGAIITSAIGGGESVIRRFLVILVEGDHLSDFGAFNGGILLIRRFLEQ